MEPGSRPMPATPASARPKAGGGPRARTLEAAAGGQRLDNFLLRELKGVPRMLVYRLLRKGRIRLNGARAAPGAKLEAGDVVSVPPLRTGERAAGPIRGEIRLPDAVLDDSDLLVFDKPAGLAVHGGSGLGHGLIEAARQELGEPGLELAHRLDRETSGLVVLARTRAALRSFHEQLREGKVRKSYRALVLGRWSEANSRIELPLRKVPAARGSRRSVVDEGGARSETRCSCERQLAAGAALRLALVTGKTHQARVHLAEVGNPILGDPRYGDRKANAAARRAGCRGLMLHAHGLSFRHPGTGKRVDLKSPLPDRFASARKWLARKEEG